MPGHLVPRHARRSRFNLGVVNSNRLGEFLLTARARLQPEDAGLTSMGRRRVAGLRREEVAVLAGMNTDYYARLEQGRENRPSPQILDALSGALQLDDNAREHLFALAGVVGGRKQARPVDAIDPSLRQLLDGYLHTPAFVLNPALDVLAANGVAHALFSPFERSANLAFMTFLDPAARSFYREWHRSAESVVANLRQATGTNDFPRLRAVVDELRRHGEFDDLWRRPRVAEKTSGRKKMTHPDVGELDVRYHTFDVRGADGQQLVVYSASPESPTCERLILLGTLHADSRHD